jgi:hypothetical protein
MEVCPSAMRANSTAKLVARTNPERGPDDRTPTSRQHRRRRVRHEHCSAREKLPNGSRLSCGRNARGREVVERRGGAAARERNCSLLVSARQLQAHVRQCARFLPLGSGLEERA